jgi:toxin ParE1/3/4
MASLELTPLALLDLEEVDHDGARDFGERAADAYATGLRRAFDLLELYPLSSPARPDFGAGVRSRVYRAHRILYTFDGDTILVVRILHHSRDVSRALEQ